MGLIKKVDINRLDILSSLTVICQSFAEVYVTGAVPLEAVSQGFIYLVVNTDVSALRVVCYIVLHISSGLHLYQDILLYTVSVLKYSV